MLGPGHTKDIKNDSGPCLHGTQDEVGTTKLNWLVTGWVSMSTYKERALGPTATNRDLIS